MMSQRSFFLALLGLVVLTQSALGASLLGSLGMGGGAGGGAGAGGKSNFLIAPSVSYDLETVQTNTGPATGSPNTFSKLTWEKMHVMRLNLKSRHI